MTSAAKAKPRRHRWVRIPKGGGYQRCTRRGCGLLRKASGGWAGGWAYRRAAVPGRPVGIWVERQLLPDVPRCAP